jgi:hypothetical protein
MVAPNPRINARLESVLPGIIVASFGSSHLERLAVYDLRDIGGKSKPVRGGAIRYLVDCRIIVLLKPSS